MSAEPRDFEILWDEFMPALRNGDGTVHFFLIDNYENYDRWCSICRAALPLIGSRPLSPDRYDDYPEGNWRIKFIAMGRPNNYFWEFGLDKPQDTELPILYAMTEGRDIGQYISNFEFDEAIPFLLKLLGKA